MKPCRRLPRTPCILSDSIHHQLNMYALAATAAGIGMLALARPAEAKVIYTKTHLVIAGAEHYYLDLNHDKLTDFTLANFWSTSCVDEQILHSFVSTPADGWEPKAAVVLDAAGNLYGTTYVGGAYQNYGTVFKHTPGGNGHWSENVLHNFDFNGMDGYYPLAGLALDDSGNLYGTTVVGGTTTNGAVFEMAHGKNGSWSEKVLYSFTGGSVAPCPIQV